MELLNSTGKTDSQIAEESGVGTSCIRKLRSGKSIRVTVNTYLALLNAAGYDLEFVLHD